MSPSCYSDEPLNFVIHFSKNKQSYFKLPTTFSYTGVPTGSLVLFCGYNIVLNVSEGSIRFTFLTVLAYL